MSAMCKAIRDKRDKPTPDYPGEIYRVVLCPQHIWPALLVAKMHEEVEEIRREPKDVYEYADLLQALFDHAAIYGIDQDRILNARALKEREAGGFTECKMLIRS